MFQFVIQITNLSRHGQFQQNKKPEGTCTKHTRPVLSTNQTKPITEQPFFFCKKSYSHDSFITNFVFP